jgi:sugar lactone lactonase YvrE
MPLETEVLIDGLVFAEGPRWRNGRLWFSDMHAHRVMTVDEAGKQSSIVEVPSQPSGLGWLPDGRLLIVSMTDRRLLRYDGSKLEQVGDLSALATGHCNDMVVDTQGRAYIGNFGFDFDAGEKPVTTDLIMVTPDGDVRVVAHDLMFPNGMVITPDGRQLIVGESFAARLTAFDIEPDGSLSNRRLWAQLDGAVPDGICLDAEAAIWVASPPSNAFLRVHEGGEISERVEVDQMAIACMLGGADRRTLFCLTSAAVGPDEVKADPKARIETVRVEVAGAGLP